MTFYCHTPGPRWAERIYEGAKTRIPGSHWVGRLQAEVYEHEMGSHVEEKALEALEIYEGNLGLHGEGKVPEAVYMRDAGPHSEEKDPVAV